MSSITYDAYLEHGQLHDALRVALLMGGNQDDSARILKVFERTDDELMRKQLGYLLASQRIVLTELEDDDALMEVVFLLEGFLILSLSFFRRTQAKPKTTKNCTTTKGHRQRQFVAAVSVFGSGARRDRGKKKNALNPRPHTKHFTARRTPL